MSPADRSLTQTYPAVAASIARARRDVHQLALSTGTPTHRLEDVKLAVSEAVTNAVRHAYEDELGIVRLTAALAGGELWVLVGDEGHGMEIATSRPGLGVGLALISQLCDHVTIAHRASGGVELRMRFDLLAGRQTSAGAQRRGSVCDATSPASPRFSTTT